MGLDYNPFRLDGKVVLITGASSGIGKETAIECSKLGAQVIITGRNSERLMETYNLLEGEGHQQIIADITNETDVDTLIKAISKLDGLVNNAGIGLSKPLGFIKKEHLEKIYETNAFAPILVTEKLIKNKKLNKNASIVFTSSIASKINEPGNCMYSTTKAAIESYSRSCAKELSHRGIRSNSVHPGMIETKLIQNTAYSEEDKQKDKELYALKRYGQPEEVARPICFLLSDASSFITGHSMIIDGGRLLN